MTIPETPLQVWNITIQGRNLGQALRNAGEWFHQQGIDDATGYGINIEQIELDATYLDICYRPMHDDENLDAPSSEGRSMP
ncbi:hypothetical protein [Sciscionella marina]|uniref:hypothetical protein n=1 Tax=Sciscionella marina TaxID=508770 RepID=UPI0003734994|nr:hypothetical protein [Sciscionella marina]